MAGSHSMAAPPRGAPITQRAKSFHIAPGHWAGHMRIYHRICHSLADAGYAVELAAHPAPYDRLDPRLSFHSLGEMGALTFSWRLGQRLQRSRHAYDLALASGADLFHFYAPEFITWAVRLRRRTGRPVIFDCMEDFEGYTLQRRGIPDMLRKPLARLVRAQLRYAARNVDAVVVSDRGTGRLLEPWARRLLVVHNFPQMALFPDPGEPGVDKPYDITYHGSMPRYHLEVILAVDDALVARGRRVRWRFIGRLPEQEWLLQEIARRNASERFIHLDQIPHSQVAAEVCRAKIGIIPLPDRPKFHNNIPQKLFEFMALRLPVVLSDLPPSRPFAGDGSCAFMVPPDDPGAYAEAICRLLDSPTLRREMGSEGRKRFETLCNWEHESQTLLALCNELSGSA